jgi:membrane protein
VRRRCKGQDLSQYLSGKPILFWSSRAECSITIALSRNSGTAFTSKVSDQIIAGLLASLWSANAGIKSLFDALNLVYNEPEKRGFIWLNAISLTFTVLAIVFALVAIGAMVVVPIVLNFIGLGGATETVVKIARWPALLIVVTLAFAFLYRYGPSREKRRWRWSRS